MRERFERAASRVVVLDRHPGRRRHFASIPFQGSERKTLQVRATVDVHQLLRVFRRQLADVPTDRRVHDAPIRFDDLIEHDESVALVPQRVDPLANKRRRRGRQRLAISNVESIEFLDLSVVMTSQWFRIGRRESIGRAHDVTRVDRQRFQRSTQIVAVPVIADHRDGDESPDAECREVVENGAERTRRVANAGDLVRLEPRFDRHLADAWSKLEIAIEEQIADESDAQLRQTSEERLKAIEGEHGER